MKIELSKLNILPDSPNLSLKLYRLISSLDKNYCYDLVFDKADYVFDYKSCIKKSYYISNTTSKGEIKDKTKNIGIYVNNCNNINFIGNGARLLFKGRMTGIVIDNSSNISFSDFTYDYLRPTTNEFYVVDTQDKSAIIDINQDSHYKIVKNKLVFYGYDGDYGRGKCITQEYDPVNQTTKRMSTAKSWRYDFLKHIKNAEVIENNRVKIVFKNNHILKKDYFYEHRQLTRDNVAIFINNSHSVRLENLNINYMHGLGIVGQLSSDIIISKINILPSNNRHTAAFADMIHCIGCRGYVNITNCNLNGAHDDAINIHGVYTKLIKLKDNKLYVRFKHCQSYGYNYYKKGDTIELLDARTLTPLTQGIVKKSYLFNEYDTYIELDKPLNIHKKLCKSIVVDNISNNCDVLISNNKIQNIPTRGLLLSTRGNIRVLKNTIHKSHMSAIYISADASNWYESGAVKNVLIKDNTFIKCGEPVILIKPEITYFKDYIHSNISIVGNDFDLIQDKAIHIESAKDILIKDNNFNDSNQPITMINCSE